MTIKEDLHNFLISRGFQSVTDGKKYWKYSLQIPGEILNVTISTQYASRKIPMTVYCEKCKIAYNETQYKRTSYCPNCHNRCIILHATPEQQQKLTEKINQEQQNTTE